MARLFQEVIESIRSDEASITRLFGEGGRQISRARRTPQHMAQLAEAANFVAEIYEGRRPSYQLNEAMSTSDFPILFGEIMDRQVLARYQEWPATWPALARQVTVRDFRNAKYYPPLTGADARLDVVGEHQEYPESKLDEQAAISYNVKKFGRRIGFSWESQINDDLDELRNIPERFARAARRTEQRAITDLYVGVNGPSATLYTSGNKNQVKIANGAAVDNPPLSIAGLQDAYHVLMNQKDETGEPMFVEAVTLVVPPALEITARNILNATELELTQAGGIPNVANTTATPTATGEQRLRVANWMRNNLTLVVDPYIPMTAVTANGTTSWFMFANPNVSRPAMLMAFLRGYETPQILLKSANAQRVGGGPIDPMDGDFDTDAVQYRIRHVLGAALIDPKATVASNGSGA